MRSLRTRITVTMLCVIFAALAITTLLSAASNAISDVFKHSAVFRVGGDEFSVILRNEDYHNLEALMEQFDQNIEMINESASEPWEQVKLSRGFAAFNPSEDRTVTGVMQRADKLMYDNKRERKAVR